EVNRKLLFDREQALGMRLNIPAGTAVRFEAGQSHEVELVELAGDGLIHGFNRLVEGNINDPDVRKAALEKMAEFIK
ncbi:MAG TPA: urease subunit beta, partial [Candidatus Melainabacteria bacterium]|nr:urease subunit beta [Candidatus Melainabacteria bacterium]